MGLQIVLSVGLWGVSMVKPNLVSLTASPGTGVGFSGDLIIFFTSFAALKEKPFILLWAH